MDTRTTIDRYGVMTEPATLVIQRWLPGPVDRIWRYLVESDLRKLWLAEGEMQLVADAPLELVWRNDALSDPADLRPEGFSETNRLQSRVISFDPMRELKIAWGEGDVTFVLEPKGDRVLLTLTHTGLAVRDTRTKVAAGWHTHLDILVAVAGDARGPSFWSTWRRLQQDYDQRLPA